MPITPATPATESTPRTAAADLEGSEGAGRLQSAPAMRRICVYCGSHQGDRREYGEAAADFGRLLAGQGLGLVYGGGGVGLMGRLADAVLAAGGRVTGVIPHGLVVREAAHPRLSDLRVVDSMHERKALMAELSDGFAVLPGGLGTLEELAETLTWGQLGIHAKPCGLLNVAGYFDPLIAFLNHAVEEGFVRPQYRALLQVGETPEELLDRLRSYRPPAVPRWISADES